MEITRLDSQEAMKFIGCGYTMLYQLIKSGKLDGTYYMVGNRRIFIKSKLEEWILNGGTKERSE